MTSNNTTGGRVTAAPYSSAKCPRCGRERDCRDEARIEKAAMLGFTTMGETMWIKPKPWGQQSEVEVRDKWRAAAKAIIVSFTGCQG